MRVRGAPNSNICHAVSWWALSNLLHHFSVCNVGVTMLTAALLGCCTDDVCQVL